MPALLSSIGAIQKDIIINVLSLFLLVASPVLVGLVLAYIPLRENPSMAPEKKAEAKAGPRLYN